MVVERKSAIIMLKILAVSKNCLLLWFLHACYVCYSSQECVISSSRNYSSSWEWLNYCASAAFFCSRLITDLREIWYHHHAILGDPVVECLDLPALIWCEIVRWEQALSLRYVSDRWRCFRITSFHQAAFVCSLSTSSLDALYLIQGVTGGRDQTSGDCSLGQTIPI